MLDIKESRRICDAATPGPWRSRRSDLDNGAAYVESDARRPGIPTWWAAVAAIGDRIDGHRDANAAFIAHARTALPAALDEIERLTESGKVLIATIDRLRAEIADLKDQSQRQYGEGEVSHVMGCDCLECRGDSHA